MYEKRIASAGQAVRRFSNPCIYWRNDRGGMSMIVDARTRVAHALEAAGVETEIITFEYSTATSQ